MPLAFARFSCVQILLDAPADGRRPGVRRCHTALPIKVTLPGPYLLTRAKFVPELTRAYYPDKEALAEDVVALLRAELEELRSAGADSYSSTSRS